MVRDPHRAQVTVAARYCGVIGSRIPTPTGGLVRANEAGVGVGVQCGPGAGPQVHVVARPFHAGSGSKTFQPGTVRGFLRRYTASTDQQVGRWARGAPDEPAGRRSSAAPGAETSGPGDDKPAVVQSRRARRGPRRALLPIAWRTRRQRQWSRRPRGKKQVVAGDSGVVVRVRAASPPGRAAQGSGQEQPR